MNRRVAGAVLAVALALVVIAIALWRSRAAQEVVAGVVDAPSIDESVPIFPVRLFYPGGGGLLEEAAVELPEPAVSADTSAALVEARIALTVRRLLEGPPPEGGYLAFPEGTELQSVDRVEDDIWFVSLSLPPEAQLNVGSRAELLMAYSLVNSLAFSFDEVARVALMWSGVQPETLAGHIDTTRPLLPNRDWVRPPAVGEPSGAPVDAD